MAREQARSDYGAPLIEAAKALDRRTHLIVLLGSDAGLRCGEMIALDLVPLKRGLVTVVVDTDGELPTLAYHATRLRMSGPTIE